MFRLRLLALYDGTFTGICRYYGCHSIHPVRYRATKSVRILSSLYLPQFRYFIYCPTGFAFCYAGTSYIDETANQRRTIQSAFATAQLGWKESIYLDVTARNDWSSTLANTKSENSGFFYPSVGLSWILNKTLNLPGWISFGKVRASWAQVGNDLPIGITSPAQSD